MSYELLFNFFYWLNWLRKFLLRCLEPLASDINRQGFCKAYRYTLTDS